MKIKDYIDTYHDFTGLASNVTRQLAFSAIAIIWIFKVSTEGGTSVLPKELNLPTTLVILTLIFDLLQYVVGSLLWYIFYRSHENKRSSISDNPDIEAHPWRTWVINTFFVLKILFIIGAYFFLLNYSYSNIKFT